MVKNRLFSYNINDLNLVSTRAPKVVHTAKKDFSYRIEHRHPDHQIEDGDFSKGTSLFLVVELCSQFGFGHRTSKPEIFDHPTLFGHSTILLSGFADVDDTWRGAHMSAPFSLSSPFSLFSPPYLDSCCHPNPTTTKHSPPPFSWAQRGA
jgi:hypothetical protein